MSREPGLLVGVLDLLASKLSQLSLITIADSDQLEARIAKHLEHVRQAVVRAGDCDSNGAMIQRALLSNY
jgi:hypothetical protein